MNKEKGHLYVLRYGCMCFAVSGAIDKGTILEHQIHMETNEEANKYA